MISLHIVELTHSARAVARKDRLKGRTAHRELILDVGGANLHRVFGLASLQRIQLVHFKNGSRVVWSSKAEEDILQRLPLAVHQSREWFSFKLP